MTLSLFSFNYKHTPVELREKLAASASHLPELLKDAREAAGLKELMILSTCNRVEFYFVDGTADGTQARLLEWMHRRFFVQPGELERVAIQLSQDAALKHIHRVACSLESMVIGEPQILGQLKEAYQVAAETRATGPLLNGLMPKVFGTAKRVRTETGIARFAVSVSYVAAELADKIFESLNDKTVMIVGAGEMAELALSHLCKKGIQRLLIANRTAANAVALAEKFQGSVVRYEDMPERLASADIVISSTGARGCVLDQDMVRRAMRARKGKPMFLIDIAVPRDIEPAVNDVANVYLYDIDDLQTVADANRQEREREALAAQTIIDEDVERFKAWRTATAMGPLIAALRGHFVETGEAETARMLGRLKHLSEQDAQAIRKFAHTLVNKLLHLPSTRLKQMGGDPNAPLYAEAVSVLFDLESRVAGNGESRDAGESTENVVPFRTSSETV